MGFKRSGFTLIELLVVVLIIGVLAAVALPQYDAAVKKSRLSTVMSNVKSIADSLELFYLTNGYYPNDDVTGLDFSINGCTAGGGGQFFCAKEVYDYHQPTSSQVGGFPTDQGIAYVQYLTYDTWVAKQGRRECWAENGNKSAVQVCESMGGVAIGTSGWHAPQRGTWQIYTLP